MPDYQFNGRDVRLRYPAVMGILNLTPDSFSDGGQFLVPVDALAHAHRMVEEGAQIIDLGGESTRPGSDPVSEQKELARVLPVIELLAKEEFILSTGYIIEDGDSSLQTGEGDRGLGGIEGKYKLFFR